MQSEQPSSQTSEGSTDNQQSSSSKSEQSNPLAAGINALKSYNPRNYFTINSYIDVLDSYSAWRVAKIIEITNDYAKVNFDGWNHKWDESIKLTSHKMAPFRKYTPPYTGGNKGAIRDFDFEESRDLINQTIDKMNSIVAKDFELDDAHTITQFFRGELYILIDSILSMNTGLKLSSDLKLITDLFEAFLSFFVKYLEVLPKALPQYIESRSANQHLLYLVDEKIALVSCIPEMFDTVCKIFGSVNNTGRFKLYQANEFQIKTYTTPYAIKPKERFSGGQYNMIVNAINHFASQGGFDKLKDLLKWELKGQKDPKTKVEKESMRFPLPYLKFVLNIISPITHLFSSSFKEKFANDFKAAFFDRTEKLSSKDLKDNESVQVLQLIRDSSYIFEEFFGKDAYVLCEQAELECALSILKSPYLEKKIKALSEFKDFIDRADPNADPKTLNDKKRFKYWTIEKLKSWFLQKKILELLLGDQFHVETVKRSTPILKFLANQSSLTPEHIDMLWKSTLNAHEESIRAIYEVITDLSLEVNLETLDYIYSKIKEIPIENYDEPTINLIRDFTTNAINVLATPSSSSYFSKTPKKTSKYEYYGLKLLWDAIQDKSPLNNKYIGTTLQAIAGIIKLSNFQTEREKYLTLCCENIKKGQSTTQSLLLSLHILSSFNKSGFFGIGSSFDDIINKYQKEYNLIETVVNDFDKYMKEVAIALDALQAKGAVPENKANHIFVGRYSHASQLEHRFTFLENIALQLKKGDLNIDHLKKLWNCLVKKSLTDVEKNAMISFLTKTKDSISKGKVNILGDGLMKSFFSNVLCDKEQMDGYKNMNPDIFKCFDKYFEIINEREGNLEISKNYNKIIRFDKLYGMDVMWEILFNCQNEKVIKEVKSLLVLTHLKINSTSLDDRLPIWQSLIDKVMKFMQASQNNTVITNFVSLLNQFIISFDGIRYLGKEGPSTETIEFIVVEKRDESNKRTVELPANGTLFLLRKRIAESFKLGIYDFDIYTRELQKISQDIEEDYIVNNISYLKDKEREKDLIIGMRDKPSSITISKDKFKNILVNNQSIMDLLFELLGSDNKRIIHDIWELLSFLPINKNLRSKFEKLNVEGSNGWFKLLDLECTCKLLYCLQIVDQISAASSSTGSDWNMDFISKKGFTHILKIFWKMEESKLCQVFDCKAQTAVIKLLGYYLANYIKLIQIEKDDLAKLIKKVLVGLSAVTINGFLKDLDYLEGQETIQNPPKDYVLSAFSLLHTCVNLDADLSKLISGYSDLPKMVKNGLIECNDPSTREDFAAGFSKLVEIMDEVKRPEDNVHPNSFFLSFLLNNLLNQAFSHRDKCHEFFQVAENIYNKTPEEDLVATGINFKELVTKLADHFLSLPPFESNNKEQDYLLQGLLSFLELLLKKKTDLREELLLKIKPELLKEILHSCLFEIPISVFVSGKIPPPKCKSQESRRAAFQLLQVCISGMNEITLQAIEYLRKPLLKNFWRGNSSSDWHIVPLLVERAKTGYVGLRNLGCTCYMNSLLQQFFMISDFRDTILSIEDENTGKVAKHENLLHQLKMIFGSLKLSQRQYYDPRLFCYSYKDYEGNPINVLEQMDVDEFFNNIMDKLENLIKNNKMAGITKRVFGGVLSNELICKGCPHYSEREEPFLAVSLQVKNKKNITESLQSFIQGEMLEGDNAYLCEKCDKKVPTLKRVCIKKLPNVLILVLKRFEFNYDTMQKVKVNDYCEFPTKLDMSQYTQGFLKKKEAQAKQEASSSSSEGQPENNEPEYPPEYFEYNLRGTVIHMGTAESGHYYSLIKDENSKWLEFNDNIVRQFDEKDLGHEAFGGEEKMNLGQVGGNIKGMKEKIRNAYLLFYERPNYFDENGKPVQSMLVGDIARDQLSKIDNMGAPLLEEIKEDNYQFQMTKYMFDKDYSDFIFQLLKNCESRDLSQPDKTILEACKYGITFFMTVTLRGMNRGKIPPFLKLLKSIMRGSTEICQWFISTFVNPAIVKEFLVSCNVRDMKYFIVGLLKIALKATFNAIPKDINQEEFKKTSLAKFADTLCRVVFEERDNIKLCDRLYETLAVLCSLGDSVRQYLIEKKLIGRLIYFLFAEKLPQQLYKENNKEFTDWSGEVSELGEPTVSTGVKPNELVKSYAEMVEKKKEKQQLDSLEIDYNYIIESIASLAGRCFTNTEGEQVIGISDDEKALLLTKINVLRLSMVHSSSKRGRKSISNLIAVLAYKREEFSKNLLNYLENDLMEKDDEKLKIYLIVLEKIMLIHDDHQKFRVEKGVNVLMNVIKNSAGFYRATEIVIDYLFKICSRNSLVLRLCSENKTFIKFIETWLRDNITPVAGLQNQTLKLFKQKQYNVATQAIQANQSKFISKCQDRIAKLKRIQKNESDELAPEYDSDEDFSDHHYQLNERVDFKIENFWTTAIVQDSLEEMIQFKVQNETAIWVHFDSDRMGPHLKVQPHTKNNVDYYKTA